MTLIELLWTLGILAFVMSGIIAVFVSGLHSEFDMNQRFEAQQEARLALQSIRTDLRTACSMTVSTNAVANDTVRLGYCSDSTTTWRLTPLSYRTWCARSEGGTPVHYGLYRESADDPGGCATPSSTAGIREADWLTTGSVFTPVSGTRPALTVSVPVDAFPKNSTGVYKLTDTIVLRNFPTSYTLSVSKAGTGSGTVTSSPAGIDCGSTCAHAYSTGTQVTLSAAPAVGSSFAGWSGGCSGTGTCSVAMSATESVAATFTSP